MAASTPRRLGLDIGGANLKAAHSDGPAACRPFALWKQPSALAGELRALLGSLPPADEMRLTMTAELCDCFSAKAEGVRAVVGAVQEACGGLQFRIWGIDGRFHTPEQIEQRPALAAAANWLALASVVASQHQPRAGLLIDVGSTTTDLIPFQGGGVLEAGRTDLARLRTGSLVYAGVRRTPLCALGMSVALGEGRVGLAAELFATTLDVYLALGSFGANARDCDTADGQPATTEHARRRLARMVAADVDELGETGTLELARRFDAMLQQRLSAAALQMTTRLSRSPEVIVVSGSGEFLARRLAEGLATNAEVVSLVDTWGREASVAACARALLELDPEDERELR